MQRGSDRKLKEDERLLNINLMSKYSVNYKPDKPSTVSQMLELSDNNDRQKSEGRSVQFAPEMQRDFDRQLDPEQNLKSEFESNYKLVQLRQERANLFQNQQLKNMSFDKRNKSFDRSSQKSNNKMAQINSPAYYKNIPDDIKDQEGNVTDTSRMFSQSSNNASRLFKDPKGYGLAKPGSNDALKDVIVTQKEKLDKYRETENFLRDELKARDNYIKTLQQENQTLLQEKKTLSDNLHAFKSRSKDSMVNADSSTKITILEDQLKQRSEFEHQIITKLQDVSQKYQLQNKILKEVDQLNLELRRENEVILRDLTKERNNVAQLKAKYESHLNDKI